MAFVKSLFNVVAGAGACVAAATALPIFGAVGTITATGIAVASVVGGVCGVADTALEHGLVDTVREKMGW